MSLDYFLLRPGSGGGTPSSNTYAGAWVFKNGWADDSTVLDQRTGLGTRRPPEPLRAIEFTGTQHVTQVISPLIAYPFSICFVMKKSSGASLPVIGVSASANTHDYVTVRTNGLDEIVIDRSNSEGLTQSTVAVPALVPDWATYVVSFLSPTSADVYRGGELVAELRDLAAVPASVAWTRVHIGCNRAYQPASFLTGVVQHLGMIRRGCALVDAQGFDKTGIIGDAEVFFTFDENSTTVVYDIGVKPETVVPYDTYITPDGGRYLTPDGTSYYLPPT